MRISGRIFMPAILILFLVVSVCSAQSPGEESYMRGVAYAIEGKFDEAKNEFIKAIGADRFNESAQKSIKVIDDVINRRIKEETAVHLFKGVVYNDKGETEEAITELNKAIELNPKYAYPYNNRGIAYGRGKRLFDLAIADFNKAIELNPLFADAYNNRAISYYFKKDYGRAWEDVHKAQSLGMEVHPGFLKALREDSDRRQ